MSLRDNPNKKYSRSTVNVYCASILYFFDIHTRLDKIITHKIFTQDEIDAAKQSPSFEDNLKYLGLIGNVFHTKDIEAAIEKGRQKQFDTKLNSYSQKSVGLDPGFGSSNFGVCVTELVNGMVNVLHAEEYPKPDFNEMIKTTISLLEKYDIRFDNSCRIFVDAANPSFISTLKQAVNEDSD